MEDCLFCKIANKELDAKIRYEDDEFIAFNDISPSAKTHVLFIPKKHVDSIIKMSEEEKDHELIGRLILTARNWAKQNKIDGYKLQFHCGKGGGQIVFHVHLHLLSNQI